jgi:hypothetical protein
MKRRVVLGRAAFVIRDNVNMRRRSRGLLALVFVLGTLAAFVGLRPTRPPRSGGPIYSVTQVEAMLAHPRAGWAGRTVRVRALVLPGCPWNNGTGAWYECNLVPASLSILQTVRMTNHLTVEARYPGAAHVFLHKLPVVGGFFPLQNENRSMDINPHVYRVLLAPSGRCNRAITGGLAPCPAA